MTGRFLWGWQGGPAEISDIISSTIPSARAKYKINVFLFSFFHEARNSDKRLRVILNMSTANTPDSVGGIRMPLPSSVLNMRAIHYYYLHLYPSWEHIAYSFLSVLPV